MRLERQRGLWVPSPALIRFLRSEIQSCCCRRQVVSSPQQHRIRKRELHGSSRRSPLSGYAPPRAFQRHSSAPPSSRRPFSSSRPSSLWSLFTGAKKRKMAPGLRGTEMTGAGSSIEDSIGHVRMMKSSNELRLRCTEFDENGNVTLVNGEFRKSELIARVSTDSSAAIEIFSILAI